MNSPDKLRLEVKLLSVNNYNAVDFKVTLLLKIINSSIFRTNPLKVQFHVGLGYKA